MTQIASFIGYDSNIDSLVASSNWCTNLHPYTFINIASFVASFVASFDKPLPLPTYLALLVRSRAKDQNTVPTISTIIHHFHSFCIIVFLHTSTSHRQKINH
uniref:Uncharacterized protein n=1 Tax=Medicago truncatula TaxID=3880 RepID=A2Q2X2_MEDTR|nr:hypothetical protein MtrDRAFT_AC152185g44v2 [Medicago truncatula]